MVIVLQWGNDHLLPVTICEPWPRGYCSSVRERSLTCCWSPSVSPTHTVVILHRESSLTGCRSPCVSTTNMVVILRRTITYHLSIAVRLSAWPRGYCSSVGNAITYRLLSASRQLAILQKAGLFLPDVQIILQIGALRPETPSRRREGSQRGNKLVASSLQMRIDWPLRLHKCIGECDEGVDMHYAVFLLIYATIRIGLWGGFLNCQRKKKKETSPNQTDVQL